MMKMSRVALFGTSALAIPATRTHLVAVAAPSAVRYVVAANGNEARYRVREQLLHHDLPSDAVGKTTSMTGAKMPIGTAEQSFDVMGNLTVHGVAKPTVWHVKAKSRGNDVTGSGWTQFTFTDVQLAQPRVPVLLSVADTIKLEYDFHLVKQP